MKDEPTDDENQCGALNSSKTEEPNQTPTGEQIVDPEKEKPGEKQKLDNDKACDAPNTSKSPSLEVGSNTTNTGKGELVNAVNCRDERELCGIHNKLRLRGQDLPEPNQVDPESSQVATDEDETTKLNGGIRKIQFNKSEEVVELSKAVLSAFGEDFVCDWVSISEQGKEAQVFWNDECYQHPDDYVDVKSRVEGVCIKWPKESLKWTKSHPIISYSFCPDIPADTQIVVSPAFVAESTPSMSAVVPTQNGSSAPAADKDDTVDSPQPRSAPANSPEETKQSSPPDSSKANEPATEENNASFPKFGPGVKTAESTEPPKPSEEPPPPVVEPPGESSRKRKSSKRSRSRSNSGSSSDASRRRRRSRKRSWRKSSRSRSYSSGSSYSSRSRSGSYSSYSSYSSSCSSYSSYSDSSYDSRRSSRGRGRSYSRQRSPMPNRGRMGGGGRRGGRRRGRGRNRMFNRNRQVTRAHNFNGGGLPTSSSGGPAGGRGRNRWRNKRNQPTQQSNNRNHLNNRPPSNSAMSPDAAAAATSDKSNANQRRPNESAQNRKVPQQTNKNANTSSTKSAIDKYIDTAPKPASVESQPKPLSFDDSEIQTKYTDLVQYAKVFAAQQDAAAAASQQGVSTCEGGAEVSGGEYSAGDASLVADGGGGVASYPVTSAAQQQQQDQISQAIAQANANAIAAQQRAAILSSGNFFMPQLAGGGGGLASLYQNPALLAAGYPLGGGGMSPQLINLLAASQGGGILNQGALQSHLMEALAPQHQAAALLRQQLLQNFLNQSQ